MRTEVLHIPWNVVTKDYELTESVQRKLRQKISKLERLLGDFPHDAVHLQIALERQPKKPRLSAALTLRVPSNILHSEKTAPDPLSATTRALEGLQRQLKSLKAKLARAPVWKRKQSRAQLHAAKAVRFAPTPITTGAGPQTLRDVVADFLQHQHRQLLRHVSRHVRHDELAGEIPRGAIDPRSVVDAVALQVLSAPHQKPEPMSWLVWFYHLLHQELRRRRARQQPVEEVRLEETIVVPEDAEAAAGYDLEQPLNLIQEALEPPVAEEKDRLPDPRTAPPEQIVVAKDLLEHLQRAIQTWPRPEREIFELYFVEGFEPDEIAMITAKPLQKIRDVIANLQHRLRQELLAPPLSSAEHTV